MLLDPHTHITGKRQLEHVLAHIRAYGGGRSVVLPIEPGDCTGVGSEAGAPKGLSRPLSATRTRSFPFVTSIPSPPTPWAFFAVLASTR